MIPPGRAVQGVHHIRGSSVDNCMVQLAGRFSIYLDLWGRQHAFTDPTFQRVTSEPSSPDREKPMMEISVLLEVANPRDRLVYCKNVDIYNLVGQWIYLLSGSESVHPIEFYNPIGRRFVDEETNATRLRGAWGARLFGTGSITKAIDLLRESPGTRRCVIPVWEQDDLGKNSRNVPCLTSVQFSIKGGRLDCFVTMRSQAAVGVMPYDLFLLTMLHEYVSVRTGVPMGEYVHFAPLCGIRESEVETLRKMEKSTVLPTEMPPMEKLDSGKLALFHYCERKIRRTSIYPIEEVEQLPAYWRGFLVLALLKAGTRLSFQQIKTFPKDFLDRNLPDEKA